MGFLYAQTPNPPDSRKKLENIEMKKLILTFVCLFLVGLAQAKIIFVDADAPGPAHDGSSWADAFNLLQDAFSVAQYSDEIHVAQGIYKPDANSADPNGSGDRTATFQLKNGVILKGGYAGFGELDPDTRNIKLYKTILSGDLAGNDVDVNDPCDLPTEPTIAENSYHVVTSSGTDETAVLDGFTITGGNANGTYPDYSNGGGVYNRVKELIVENCTFMRNSARLDGAGIYNRYCEPTVTNCTFRENSAQRWGGGMANFGFSRPKLTSCEFTRNWAGWGGGIHNNHSYLIATNCTFSGNSAGSAGAIDCYSSNKVTLTNCTFSSNCADGGGGAIHIHQSDPVLTNCTFSDNVAGYSGVAIRSHSYSILRLTNCMFSGNQAAVRGGAMHSEFANTVSLTTCTFTANVSVVGNTLSCDSFIPPYVPMTVGPATEFGTVTSFQQRRPSNVQVTNCILWDGGNEIWNNDGSTITITYSDVQGGQTEVYDPCEGLIWGDGNIEADPFFGDPNNGDYHLMSQAGRWTSASSVEPDPNSQSWVQDAVTSPCIDAGNPDSPIGLEPFPNGGRINMGAYGGTIEASKSYFGKLVCETIVAGDINGDCKVNFKDFALMVLHWLQDYNSKLPPPPPPP